MITLKPSVSHLVRPTFQTRFIPLEQTWSLVESVRKSPYHRYLQEFSVKILPDSKKEYFHWKKKTDFIFIATLGYTTSPCLKTNICVAYYKILD